MKLADFGKIKTRLLICGALLVGGTLFAGVIACPQTMAAILASGGAGLAGVAGNLLAEMVGGDLGTLAESLGQNDDLLSNYDLTRAVSRAIAVVIQSVARTNKFPAHKDILNRLAKTAAESECWAGEVQELQKDDRFSGIKEDQLPAIFSTDAEKFAQVRVLDQDAWKQIVDWLCSLNGVSIPELRNYLSERLYTTFPKHCARC